MQARRLAQASGLCLSGDIQRREKFQWIDAVGSLAGTPAPAGRETVAARLGVEPRQTESESVVLPLHHRAVKPFIDTEEKTP